MMMLMTMTDLFPVLGSQLQAMKPLEEKIFLNIGGLRYETYASTLQVFPGTKLCCLTEPQAAATFDYDPDTKEYFFDRSSYLFEEVLNYYRTKELHCSDLICKSVLDEELAYWGLNNTLLAPCCWQKLIIAEGQKEEYGIPEENQEAAGLLEQAGRNQSAWRGRWQSRIWTTFEKPFSSLSAKVLKLVETPVMLRVLSYTSRAAIREILVLLMILVFEILFFGSLCYFVDIIEDNTYTQFADIGSAFWWAMVTLTTVGYGDVVPISLVGKMIGACTALCGVLTIIIPIPFFCIKFQGYYDAVMIKEKRKSKKKTPLTLVT
ncbi:hypothetical protein Chor_004385 [Crotalus horridus]